MKQYFFSLTHVFPGISIKVLKAQGNPVTEEEDVKPTFPDKQTPPELLVVLLAVLHLIFICFCGWSAEISDSYQQHDLCGTF